jgi:hypothetical protein
MRRCAFQFNKYYTWILLVIWNFKQPTPRNVSNLVFLEGECVDTSQLIIPTFHSPKLSDQPELVLLSPLLFRQLSKATGCFRRCKCDKIAAPSVFLLWTSTSRATPNTFGNCQVEIGSGLVSTLDAFLRIGGPVSVQHGLPKNLKSQ